MTPIERLHKTGFNFKRPIAVTCTLRDDSGTEVAYHADIIELVPNPGVDFDHLLDDSDVDLNRALCGWHHVRSQHPIPVLYFAPCNYDCVTTPKGVIFRNSDLGLMLSQNDRFLLEVRCMLVSGQIAGVAEI